MRLAFAVAAHLDPEILLIDEVLAVGDVEFQKKCLGKMGEVARGGRTILFVSHNLAAVASLCARLILLDSGSLVQEGEPSEVIEAYIGRSAIRGQKQWESVEDAPGSDRVRIRAVRVVAGGAITGDVGSDSPFEVEVDYWNLKEGTPIACGIGINAADGTRVFDSANFPSACMQPDEWFDRPAPQGVFRSRCTVPGYFLNVGRYTVTARVFVGVGQVEAAAERAVAFDVHEEGGMRREHFGNWIGIVRPRLAWSTRPLDASEAGTGSQPGGSEMNTDG